MMTTLVRDPGESWAAAGRSIAGGLAALLQGEAVRQKAQQEQEQALADIYYRNMAGNKYGAEAEGLRLTNEARLAPIDTNLPSYLQVAQRLFQMTGDTNAQQLANAGTAIQTQSIRDQALANVGNLDTMNRLNTLAQPGQTYMPFRAVGDTGAAIDQATGQGAVFDPVLRKLFSQESDARAARDRGAASKFAAQADIERQKAEYLRKTGALPGTGADGSEGALSPTIMRTLLVPALDEKGRPVRNPITGEVEMTIDQGALARFYTWVSENGRRPTATAFAQWEAAGRPGGNKNPPPAPSAPKIDVQAALAKAREAIAKGAPRDKVIERLRQNGIDPSGL